MRERAILVAVDHPEDQRQIELILRRSGVPNRIVSVNHADDARDYIFSLGEWEARGLDPLPVVAMLQIGLPGIPLPDLLRRIRSHDVTWPLPVIVLSRSEEDRDEVAEQGLGPNGFLTLPVDQDALLHAVRRVARSCFTPTAAGIPLSAEEPGADLDLPGY